MLFIHWPQRLHLLLHPHSLCDSGGKWAHECAAPRLLSMGDKGFLPQVTCATWGEMQPCRHLAGVTNSRQINFSHRLPDLPLCRLRGNASSESEVCGFPTQPGSAAAGPSAASQPVVEKLRNSHSSPGGRRLLPFPQACLSGHPCLPDTLVFCCLSCPYLTSFGLNPISYDFGWKGKWWRWRPLPRADTLETTWGFPNASQARACPIAYPTCKLLAGEASSSIYLASKKIPAGAESHEYR